jgi:hypothetical protein
VETEVIGKILAPAGDRTTIARRPVRSQTLYPNTTLYAIPQDQIFMLKIPMGTRNILSENCQQFGHALSKMFASPNPTHVYIAA